MHYLVVSLFCDLVWPLYIFIRVELSSVTALFALFINIKLVLIGTLLLCPNPGCSRTDLNLEWPYKVSIILQILSVALNKCTRITRKLAMGAVMAFVLR